jgi:hexosaminidase
MEPLGVVPRPQSMTSTGMPALRIGERPRVVVDSEGLRGLGGVVVDLLDRLHGVDAALQVGGVGDLTITLVQDLPAAHVAARRGLDPLDQPMEQADLRERYELVVGDSGARVTACSAEGLFRGATTVCQLLAREGAGGPLTAPGTRIVDGPGFGWRGLSLDVVRRFFTVAQVKKVIDLLALYKFNVLHLHLTDSQAWRLEISGWPRLTAPGARSGGESDADRGHLYTGDDYHKIVAYAADRFVTVVPEIDLPGHTLAAVRAYPELQGAHDPPHEFMAFIDPHSGISRRFVHDVFHEVAGLTPGPYLHIGGDEAFGMPDDLYAAFIRQSLDVARRTGKRVVAWQEAVRSGALLPRDVAQAWVGHGAAFDADAAREQAPPEHRALIDFVAQAFEAAPHDVPAAVAGGVPVLASPNSFLYLDRRYAEDSRLTDQTARRSTVGLGSYEPRTCRELFDWDPLALTEIPEAAQVAGVEAAIWCETVTGFDDLAFLLLPRLTGIAEKAWTGRRTDWQGYRDRVTPHAALWERLGWGGYYRSVQVFGQKGSGSDEPR